ncbi:MAG TPA: ribulose phosphate epimerase, partial [Nannocystaceae bacterium]|nr:ribulose phosphate epimerase [Nannocystaceae bacterium]
NATICVPVDGTPGAPGDPCTVGGNPYSGFDDCQLGAMCWNVDPATNEGTCVANCGGTEASPVCEDPTTRCFIAYEGVVHVCLPGCDPLLQDCPAAATCLGVDAMFVCVPDNSGPMGAVGDACDDFNDCDPGLFCADPTAVPDCGGAGCCAQFCDVGIADPLQCALADDGVQCVPWFEFGTAPVGYEATGACVIPM